MCLDAGYSKMDSTTLIQSGWKRFGGSGKALEFEARSFAKSKNVPLDRWIAAEGSTVEGGTYRAGFHIYEDELETRKEKSMRMVYYRRAHTRGRQDGMKVVVASEMYVASNPDDWPAGV